MPGKTILEIPEEEQERMLSQLRQARYGYLLRLHILLLCAAGHTPTEIADVLFCSRSSIYRTVEAYQSGAFACCWSHADETPVSTRLCSWQRSLVALLKRTPQAYGWCRTRWSCQTLALQLAAGRGYIVSRETSRRTLHRLGYAWKRARHAARDDDPQRTEKLARIRHLVETLPGNAALFTAFELDIHLLPKLGYEWMLPGTQTQVMTPGKNEKNYLAGALNFVTGTMLHVVGERKKRWLFIDLLKAIDRTCPARQFPHIHIVVDN